MRQITRREKMKEERTRLLRALALQLRAALLRQLEAVEAYELEV